MDTIALIVAVNLLRFVSCAFEDFYISTHMDSGKFRQSPDQRADTSVFAFHRIGFIS